MKKSTLLIPFFFLYSAFSFSQSTCATSQSIVAGSHIVDAVNGTEVPTPICAQNGTGATMGKWYKYIPTQNYTVTVTTDLQINSGKDTRFHIYTGTCGALSCHAGDDDSGIIGTGYLSISTFNVMAGTVYYVAFDNKWNSSGFTFNLIENTFVPTPVAPVTFSAQGISTINSSYNIAVVDMNNDYLDDIVGVSSTNIKIHYQTATPNSFTIANITTSAANNLPTWSLAAADYNKDGYTDLMYGGGNGTTFMKSESGGLSFSKVNPGQYIFCQRTNFIDLNNDGNLDAFSCHDVQPNVYYLNDGLGNFIYYQSNVTLGAIALGIHPEGGNYGSIWIDYDNDGDQDLFISKCRGGNSTAKFNELHRNNGNGTFTDVSIASNLRDALQTWSSAWADFDNDGDMDVLVGASSNVDGNHKLMMNNGNETFTDITLNSGWDTNASVNIEHVAYDFDNNGFVDVLGGGNKIMFNNGNNTFTPVPVSFSAGAIGDLNNDGFLDVQVNTNVYYNNKNSNNWIKLNLLGNVSNRNGIGARVEIYGSWGKQIRDVRSGDGFKYANSLNVHFGIGTATAITKVVVKWPSGIVDVINNPTINQSLLVVENSSPLTSTNFTSNKLIIYPNPAIDVLNLITPNDSSIKSVKIFDTMGRLILKPELTNQSIYVQKLQSGSYFVLIQDTNGNEFSQQFLKK
jgi:hypothetical protein